VKIGRANCEKNKNDRPTSSVRVIFTRFLPYFRHFAAHLVVRGPRVPTRPALRALHLRLVDGARLCTGQEGFLLINLKFHSSSVRIFAIFSGNCEIEF
jgi:hypothetical protein